eukprot:9047687-Karenia_brevis.AAC.1
MLEVIDLDTHTTYKVLRPSRKRLWSKTQPLYHDLIIKRRTLADGVAVAAWRADEERAKSRP